MRARTIDTQRKEEEEEASPFTKLQLGEEKSIAFDQQREREREACATIEGRWDGESAQRNDNEARGDITRCVHRVTI